MGWVQPPLIKELFTGGGGVFSRMLKHRLHMFCHV